MPFQLSPGVQVVEKDFTTVVPAVSTSNGAFCGPFSWGPMEEPLKVSNESELALIFGRPNDSNFASWFTASNFLAYSNNLLVTRINSDANNAVSSPSAGIRASNLRVVSPGSGYANGTYDVTFSAPFLDGGVTAEGTATWAGDDAGEGTWTFTITENGSGYTLASDATPDVTVTIAAPVAPADPPQGVTYIGAQFEVNSLDLEGIQIKNLDHYLSNYSNETSVSGVFASKFPGSRANGLEIHLVDAGNWNTQPSKVTNALPKSAPGTSPFAQRKGVKNDEVHLLIFDTSQGSFSGTAGALLEKFEYMSKLSDAQLEDGSSNYYKNVINQNSKYLWHLRHPGSNVMSEFLSGNTNSGDGVDGSYVIFEETSGIEFVKAEGGNSSYIYITINDAGQFANIVSFKGFVDANSDENQTRQILVTGTSSNNFALTVSSIEAVTSTVTVGEVTTTVIDGYRINVVETFVNDEQIDGAFNPVSIQSLIRVSWGRDADTAVGFAGDNVIATLSDNFVQTLRLGTDSSVSPTSQNYQDAYSVLANTELYDISLLPLSNVGPAIVQYVINNVAEVRKDCVVFFSPNTATAEQTSGSQIMSGPGAVTSIKNFKNAVNTSTSYAFMDSGFKYMYDRYNDKYRWVPLSGDMAGLCARTDLTTDPWFSPGGFNRGVVKNIIKLAFNPNQSQRDDLYIDGINPVVTFRGQGTVLYGDKTLLARPSAFDRINVRRLFIVLEKAIAIASRSSLFEFNDAFTRAQFKNLVEPFLRDVQGRRGITEFLVVCDETNNTGEVIDRNEFIADIYIKPNRSINFITLNFIAARSSISFEEIGA